jgi:tetratricopeptide (TPR) repeat protein
MSWSKYHIQSEQHAIAAELASKSHDNDLAIKHYGLAAKAEVNALNCLSPDKTRTIGITVVSATSLYFMAQDFSQARIVAQKWLAIESLPPFAIKELQDLLEDINKQELVSESIILVSIGNEKDEEHQVTLKQQEDVDKLLQLSSMEIQKKPLFVENNDLQKLAELILKQDWQPEDLNIYPLTFQAQICMEIGKASRKKKYWFKGLHWLKACWKIHQQLDDLYGLAEVSYELAISHHIANNFDYSGVYYRDAKRIFQYLGDIRKLAFCQHGLGRLLLQMNKNELAITELEQALTIYKDISNLPQIKLQINDINYLLKATKNQELETTY